MKVKKKVSEEIKTLEGVVLVLFNVAMIVVPLVSNALSASTAVKYAGILNMVYIFAAKGESILASLGARETTAEQKIVTDTATVSTLVNKQVGPLEKGSVSSDIPAAVADVQEDLPNVEQLVTDVEEAVSQPPPIKPESATKPDAPVAPVAGGVVTQGGST